MTNVTPPPVAPHPHKHGPRPNLAHPGVLLATWFGAGYLPKAPGTWGSLGALPFAWLIMDQGGVWSLVVACVAVFAVGLWASWDYMKRTNLHDPGSIVVDEVAGQWIVLCLAPLDPVVYALGFALFRLFDVLKPWPVSWADRRVGGALGVMLDDVLAGLYGLGVLWAVLYVAGDHIVGGL